MGHHPLVLHQILVNDLCCVRVQRWSDAVGGLPGTFPTSFQDKQAQLEPGPQSSPEYPEYVAPLYTVPGRVLNHRSRRWQLIQEVYLRDQNSCCAVHSYQELAAPGRVFPNPYIVS